MFSFNNETSDKVKQCIEYCYNSKLRVRIWYGDTDTGVSWMDEYDTMGAIGRSTGQQKIPLLIKNSRSSGGSGVLCHCIIRIDVISSKRTIYEHPLFNVPMLTVATNNDNDTKNKYPFIVSKNNELQARFKSEKQAKNYIDFMAGKCYTTGGK